jgi:hypothetical protein
MKKALLILCSLVFLFSCRERINLDLGTTFNRLVVEGGITNDTMVHTVILSTTMPYLSEDSIVPYISGKTLTITELESGNITTLIENDSLPGRYQTPPDYFAKQGFNYRLDIFGVDIDGDGEEEEYTATAYCPFIADKIDSINCEYNVNILMNAFIDIDIGMTRDSGWNIRFSAQDPPTEEYYIFIPSLNDTSYNNHLSDFFTMPDNILDMNGMYFQKFPIHFFSNRHYNIVAGDSISLEIRCISLEYYNYINEYQDVMGGSNPFFGSSPANVRGNVSGNAIGFFAAYCNRKAYVIVSE